MNTRYGLDYNVLTFCQNLNFTYYFEMTAKYQYQVPVVQLVCCNHSLLFIKELTVLLFAVLGFLILFLVVFHT